MSSLLSIRVVFLSHVQYVQDFICNTHSKKLKYLSVGNSQWCANKDNFKKTRNIILPFRNLANFYQPISVLDSSVYGGLYEYVVSLFCSCPNPSICSHISDALGLQQEYILYLEKQALYSIAKYFANNVSVYDTLLLITGFKQMFLLSQWFG